MAWTGSPPCRRRWPSPTAPSAPQRRPSCSAGSAASHQIGAAAAAFFAGASRTATGSYLDSFVTAGFVAVGAAFLALMIGRKGPKTGTSGSLGPARLAGDQVPAFRTLFKPLKLQWIISAAARHETGKDLSRTKGRSPFMRRALVIIRLAALPLGAALGRPPPPLPFPGSRTWSMCRASATTCWSAMAWWSA